MSRNCTLLMCRRGSVTICNVRNLHFFTLKIRRRNLSKRR